jgi:hypothetical protein
MRSCLLPDRHRVPPLVSLACLAEVLTPWSSCTTLTDCGDATPSGGEALPCGTGCVTLRGSDGDDGDDTVTDVTAPTPSCGATYGRRSRAGALDTTCATRARGTSRGHRAVPLGYFESDPSYSTGRVASLGERRAGPNVHRALARAPRRLGASRGFGSVRSSLRT